MNIIQNIAKTIIVAECKELIDTISMVPKDDLAVLSLGLIPYISLVINESLKWCNKCNIRILKLSDEENYVIKRLRVKCKFHTGDTEYSFDEQKKRLEEAIMIEKYYYENQSWLAKQLYKSGIIKDVGTYMSNERYIGNTILYSDYFEPFRDTQKSIYESGQKIFDFSVNIGKIIQSIIVTLDGKPYKCKNEHVYFKAHTYKDYFLNNCFFYSGNIDKLMLFNILCSINFIMNYLTNILDENSSLLFRIKYLTLYHATENLKQLKFFEINDNVLLKRNFRNVMAHYGIFKALEESNVIKDVMMFGLIESNFNMSFQEIVHLIDEELRIIQYNLEKEFNLNY